MNRLLLSLWLLGAAVYGANTLIYANVIFGWPTIKQKVDAGNTGKETFQPKAAAETQSQQSANTSDKKEPAEIDANGGPAVRLGSNPPPEAAPAAPPAATQTETAASDARGPAAPTPPQDQSASSASAQPQAQSTPEAQPAPGEGVAPMPESQPEQAQNVPEAQPQQQDESEWLRVSRTGANVRSAPSSSASQLTTLRSGMALRVISREAGWVQVANSDGSQTGWVYERLLEPKASASEQRAAAAAEGSAQATGPDQQPQGQGEMVKVSGAPATMRSGPSDSAPMLFGFPEGRELRVVSRQPGWVQVTDPESEQSGWIAEASLAAAGAGDQQQQAAAAAQRRSRDAPPPAYDSAEGPPPGARGAWLPWEEDMGPPSGVEEPEDRPRGWGHRRGGFAGILRRAFGGD